MTVASQTTASARALNSIPSLREIGNLAFPHAILWLAVVALFLVNASWLAINPRISIAANWYYVSFLPAVLALGLIVFRWYRAASYDWFLHRLWCLLMTLLVTAMLMKNLQVSNHLLMSIPFPLADDTLLSWDRAIGFDWLAYAKAMTTSPFTTKALFLAYNSMTIQGLIVVISAAVWLDRRNRVIELGFLLLSTAFICMTIASAFPARAAMDLLADAELLSRLSIGSGVYHLEQLFALRGSETLTMQPETLEGLATFPSYHTCLGLIILWCSRGHWLTGTMGAAVGATIVAATPIYGGHYIVDVIAGGIVMLACILFWGRYFEPGISAHMPGLRPERFAFPGWLSLQRLKFSKS